MEIREYRNYNEKEILDLYTAVGWTAYTGDPEALRRGYENSLLVLGAYEGGKLAGVIRAVGDGATVVFIQDILVFPEQQRKGIGSALLQAVLDKYEDWLRGDTHVALHIASALRHTVYFCLLEP